MKDIIDKFKEDAENESAEPDSEQILMPIIKRGKTITIKLKLKTELPKNIVENYVRRFRTDILQHYSHFIKIENISYGEEQ